MPSSRIKVIFHIGLEKTGTTSFQRFCTRNARRLIKHNILYPKRSSAFHVLNHAPLTASYLQSESPDDFYLRSTLTSSEMVESLKREIEASGAEKVIISSEHLSSRFRAPQIEKLAEDFNEYECRVVIALRDHLSRLFSAYATHVTSGSDRTIDEYAEMVLLPDNLYMRYADTIRLWEASFGSDNIIVFDYNEASDVIYSLLSKIGLLNLRIKLTDDHKCNASLDANATEALRLINIANRNERTYRSKIAYLEFIKLQYVRSVLKKKLQAQSNCSKWRLSQPYRKQLLDIAEADALWLAKNYSMPVSLIKPESLPEAAPEEFHQDVAMILAKILTQTICARWSLYRFNMFTRAALFLILEKLRSIRQR
ncbi:MAG: sulfotransferase domain-containing protein [Pseudomonadota bacterium]|nr:sulfotransferase domain-containing protein [Pseudomonadota bacterium]